MPIQHKHTDKLIESALKELDELRNLRPNWNGEDAAPISEAVIKKGKKFIRCIAREAGYSWMNPSIAPDPDGGIELSWEANNRWAMITVQPDISELGCATQENEASPSYQVESPGDAVEIVLRVLRRP
jgi:hypothetical protein